MDPNSLGNMMNMFNNPDTMGKMKDMMQQPEILNMMNNPDIMSKMMGMFSGAKPDDMSGLNDSTTPDSTTPDSTTPDSTTPDSTTPDSTTPTPLETITEDSKELIFLEDDNVVLGNLKNEKYNDLHGVILGYNQERERYIVRVSFNNDSELDNEDNGEDEDDTETISEADLETVTLEEGEGEATTECCEGEATTECCEGEATTECCEGEATTECCEGEATTEGTEVTDGLETVTLDPVRVLEPEYCDIMVKEENLILLDESSYTDSIPLTEID